MIAAVASIVAAGLAIGCTLARIEEWWDERR